MARELAEQEQDKQSQISKDSNVTLCSITDCSADTAAVNRGE